MVQDVVADAAEQRGPNGAAAAGAHHDEIVAAAGELASQRSSDRPLAQHPAHRHVVGNPLARAPEDRFSLYMRVLEQLRDR